MAKADGDIVWFDGVQVNQGESAFAFEDKPAGEGVWADYSATSTIVGWSSFTQKSIYLKKIGKIVFVAFRFEGTSDSTSTTFTLPYTAINATCHFGGALVNAQDNSVTLTTASRAVLLANTSTVLCFSDMSGGAWTASNNKVIQGSLWYESA